MYVRFPLEMKTHHMTDNPQVAEAFNKQTHFFDKKHGQEKGFVYKKNFDISIPNHKA